VSRWHWRRYSIPIPERVYREYLAGLPGTNSFFPDSVEVRARKLEDGRWYAVARGEDPDLADSAIADTPREAVEKALSSHLEDPEVAVEMAKVVGPERPPPTRWPTPRRT